MSIDNNKPPAESEEHTQTEHDLKNSEAELKTLLDHDDSMASNKTVVEREQEPHTPAENNAISDPHQQECLTGTIKSFSFKRGFYWIEAGFDLFKANWFMWVLSYCLFLIFALVISSIPFVGAIIASIIGAGFYIVAKQTQLGERFNFADLFYGFKNALLPLSAITVINIVIIEVCFRIAMPDNLSNLDPNALSPEQAMEIIRGALVGMSLYLVPFLAFVFSPILLIMNNKLTVFKAIEYSFKACLVNTMPLTAFGLALVGLSFLTVFTFGVAMMALIPLSVCALYCAYQDIFCEQVEADNMNDENTSSSSSMSA